jgi:hypothetical protein
LRSSCAKVANFATRPSAKRYSLERSVTQVQTAVFASLVAICAFSRTARAQEYTQRSFILPHGSFELTGSPARPEILDVNLSDNSVGRPINIPLRAYWGVSDDVTIGISHERGLCLNGCNGKPYNDVGFDLLAWLAGGNKYEIDLHAGVPIHSIDPFFIGIQAGVLGRVNFANVGLVFDPNLYVGFDRRNRGNGDGISLPVWFYFQATPIIVPFVGTATEGPLVDFGDQFRIPLEGGMIFSVTRDVDLGFVFRFPNLLGHHGSPDGRDTGMLGRFHF